MKLTSGPWKWLVAGAAGLLALYTAAGFVLVPWLIKDQFPKFGQAKLSRQTTIGDVSFNPYTLRLEAKELRLAEADGAPLLAIGKINAELQWQSLTRRAWSFADIRITAPSLSLGVAPDGKFNLVELLQTIERWPHQATTDTSLPRVIVDHFALEQGKVEIDDRRASYKNSFFPIDFALTHFSTLPEQAGSYSISAESAHGGKLVLKGEASVDPVRGSGELTLKDAALREFAVYLKPHFRATLNAGQLAATVPYSFAYRDGKLDANIAGARLALRDLSLTHANTGKSFATLSQLDLSDISADLARRGATVGEVHASGGNLKLRRDAESEIDLANLMIAQASPATVSTPGAAPIANTWRFAVKQLVFDQMAVDAVDETVDPPLTLSTDKMRLHLQLSAEQAGQDLKLTVADADFLLADLVLTSGAKKQLRLDLLGFTEGELDLASRRASLGRLYAEGGQLELVRDRSGRFEFLRRLANFGVTGRKTAAAPVAAAAPWTATAREVDLSKIDTLLEEQATGVKLHLQDLAVKLEGASTDLKQAVKFKAAFSLQEGGQLSAQGSVVPGTGTLATDLRIRQLSLAPLQPLLSKYLKLKIAGGSVFAQGRLTTGAGNAQSPGLRFVGGFDVSGLVLNEEQGDLFLSWKNVGADKLIANLSPDSLEIAELRVLEPDATLVIEDDRSLSTTRLLVEPPISAATATPAASPDTASARAVDPFPVRIQRLRVQNGKLDFTDLSLRPQFSAKIYELNGVVNGLSSNRQARSQIELDGRVDEFGLARIRGELNPFAPRDNTSVNVVFKNVDMAPTSPYSMKFAGYKIKEGKISLDLQYKVRDSQLEGDNHIVIDKLTLGERVDSPDALDLPIELAIAILKDSDGRIDLGLQVSGDMNNPQFSYGAIIWKAIGNVLTKIVTAPFRALGSLIGISGEKLEAIEFDPGSDKLLPPEREKLSQVGQILAKRAQLRLSVPAQYSETADGAALKARAVRVEIARRAGFKLEAGEEPGPLNLGDRTVADALRNLYAERFGAAELAKQNKAAEAGATGTPPIADTSALHRKLLDQLEQNQSLAADALTGLGAQRASAILDALKEEGVEPAVVRVSAPENISSDIGKPVSLKLGLATK